MGRWLCFYMHGRDKNFAFIIFPSTHTFILLYTCVHVLEGHAFLLEYVRKRVI